MGIQLEVTPCPNTVLLNSTCKTDTRYWLVLADQCFKLLPLVLDFLLKACRFESYI